MIFANVLIGSENDAYRFLVPSITVRLASFGSRSRMRTCDDVDGDEDDSYEEDDDVAFKLKVCISYFSTILYFTGA